MQKCAHCRGAITRTKKEETRELSGTRFLVTVPAFVCKGCRAVFMQGAALEHADLEIACVLARSGPASGETFRFIRKALGLRSASAAALLDVTAETVSRWEHGQRPVDKCAWIALGSLVLEKFDRAPETMARLLMLQQPASPARLVRIDLDSTRPALREETSHAPESTRTQRRRPGLPR
jgi:transcriptional regulator with XRE-family HTH domain